MKTSQKASQKATMYRVIGLIVACGVGYALGNGLRINPWCGSFVSFYTYIIGIAVADRTHLP